VLLRAVAGVAVEALREVARVREGLLARPDLRRPAGTRVAIGAALLGLEREARGAGRLALQSEQRARAVELGGAARNASSA